MPNTAVIAGHGPGFCEAFAWKLAEKGHPIALFARSEAYLADFETKLRDAGHEALAVPVDITETEALFESFGQVREELGPVEVLALTASTNPESSGELDPDRFEAMWQLYTKASLDAVRATIDDLRETDGTVLFFGANPEMADYAYRSAKAGARELARTLANEYGPEGVHVAHVIIDDYMLNPDVYEILDEVVEADTIDPEEAARTCYHLVEQADRGRTFELDLHSATGSGIRSR